MTGSLTTEQIDSFGRDGFLFPVRVADDRTVGGWRAEIEAVEDRWRGETALPRPFADFARANFHLVSSAAARIAHDEAILDAVESLIGPDILCWMSELIVKEPHSPKVLTMHQDLTYWGLGAIDGMVTVWLALSPATPASGCMDFVRGSHKNPILPHADSFAENNLLSRGQEVQVEVRPEDKVAIELAPGQISLHHGLTIHGSGPNVSDDRRIAAVVRYVTPEISQQAADEDFAMMARGIDRAGNFTHVAPPGRNFEARSLELYEEIRAAKAKILLKDAQNPRGLYAR